MLVWLHDPDRSEDCSRTQTTLYMYGASIINVGHEPLLIRVWLQLLKKRYKPTGKKVIDHSGARFALDTMHVRSAGTHQTTPG